MGHGEVMRSAKRAVKVLNNIQAVPMYGKVINMTHRELVSFLQELPESPFFARDDYRIGEVEAR